MGAAGTVNNRSVVNAASTKVKGADINPTTEHAAIGGRPRASLQRAGKGCSYRGDAAAIPP